MRRSEAHRSDKGAQYSTTQERGLVVKLEDEAGQLKINREPLTPRLVLRGSGVLVRDVRDVLHIGPLGSRGDWLTVTLPNGIHVTTGCFSGSLEAFCEEVADKPASDRNRREYEETVRYIEAMARLRGG